MPTVRNAQKASRAGKRPPSISADIDATSLPNTSPTHASPSSSTAEAPRELRADAKRNRLNLLLAAEAVFTERGADASMDDVAKYAKVGVGTLYRHFPTRDALLGAAVDERLLCLAERTRASAANATPTDALATFLGALVEIARTYRGLAASLGIVLENGGVGCHTATDTGRDLLAEAQKAGEVRPDVEFADVQCMATAIALTAQQTQSDAARVSRLVEMFVDGLRVPRARVAAPRAHSKSKST